MRRWAAISLTLLALGAAPIMAQSVSEVAAEALAELEAAQAQLAKAKSGKDRVRALSETVRAYEAGLSAVREGLRAATIRERALTLQLAGQEEEIAALVTVLQARGRAHSPSLFLHPEGALGTARAGMLVAEMTPAMSTRAGALRATLEEVSTLRQLQAGAEDTLKRGLEGVQEARTTLSQAIADRVALPKKFTEDPVKTALLIATADTLDAFAGGLGEIGGVDIGAASESIDARKGRLALPLEGRVLRRAGEADAAGIKRGGVIIAARPRSLVTSPSAATVRYQGPLLDFGNVMILEPREGLLMVFAGLDVVYGTIGEVLAEGAPIGLLGGRASGIGEIMTQVADGAGSDLSETLYLEVRENNEPVNPELWFRMGKDDG